MSGTTFPTRLSVLVVDDHPLVRQGLRALLETAVEDLELHEAASAEHALEQVRRASYDVAVVDLALPGSSGLSLVRAMRQENRDLPILVLSMYPENVYARRALEAGASGYVMKEAGGPVVLEALAAILQGGVYLSKEAALHVARAASGAPPAGPDGAPSGSPSTAGLTEREFEVWTLLGQGVPKPRIARRLGISRRTVESHCYNIRQKTGIANAPELVHAATRWVAQHGAAL